MKKIISFLLLTAIIKHAICQTETFDIATYTPPKGWAKDSKEGVMIYSNSNAATGGFCILAIYASDPSTGDPQKDFKSKWKDQVVIPYKAAENPKTETQTSPDGWKAVAALTTVKQDGIVSYVMLTVFSGFGKTMSVLANFNDPAYATIIDDLQGNMKIDKTNSLSKNLVPTKENVYKGGIVGVYGRRGLHDFVEAGITKTEEYGIYYIFFSNGQVYQYGRFPRDGLEGLNTIDEAVNDPSHWSTYSFQNGAGGFKSNGIDYTIRMNGNDVDITRSPGTSSGKYPYFRVPPVDGAVFNGTYIIESPYHDDKMDGSITFTTDGKFIDNGPLNILNHRLTDLYNITAKPGSGTYEVKNYSVIFKYTDGRILQIAFPGLNYDKKNQSPQRILLSYKENALIKK